MGEQDFVSKVVEIFPAAKTKFWSGRNRVIALGFDSMEVRIHYDGKVSLHLDDRSEEIKGEFLSRLAQYAGLSLSDLTAAFPELCGITYVRRAPFGIGFRCTSGLL